MQDRSRLSRFSARAHMLKSFIRRTGVSRLFGQVLHVHAQPLLILT